MVRPPHDAADQPSSASSDAQDELYFFPEQTVSEAHARQLLETGSAEERAWVISHLLRYAQWDDIWRYVSREDVREHFPALDLPDSLRTAWARMLKVEVAPVG
ncbi:MAG: hypothetical protein AAF772_17205 [Acidobacteriota bacterium]